MDDLMTICRSGMWRLKYKLSPEGRARYFKEFLPSLHDTKHEVLGNRDDDSYYLVYIGTRPAAQRMGLAKKLISNVTAMADCEGRACYLESSFAGNVSYYNKLGFEVVDKIRLSRAAKAIELDIMIREPKDDHRIKSTTPFISEKQAHSVSLVVKVGNEKTTSACLSLG